MNQKTWDLLESKYARFPSLRAGKVDPVEFDTQLAGKSISSDYRDFVLRYGGGIVGSYPIYGLLLADAMGTVEGNSTALELTANFREKNWPAVDDWIVFTIDLSGNPVGLAPDQSVWISDIEFGQVQKLAENFEDFLLKWALRVVGVGAPSPK